MKIVITGASSEIGLSIAKKFIGNEHELILQCYNNSLNFKGLLEKNKNIKIVSCDFTNNESLNLFLNELSHVDILINVAAITKTDLLVSLTDEDIKNMMQVNVFAPTLICRAVMPYMTSKRNGIIVNISSIAATKGNRGQTVYGGTKGFMESFTRSLAAEYGAKGIRANCVAPGAIEAGSLKSLINVASDEIKKNVALNRFGTVENISDAVFYLCGDNASFINGQVIHVDGGFMRGV